MTLSELVVKVQSFNSNLIIGNSENKEETYKAYPLSKEKIESRRYKHILCGDIANAFISELSDIGVRSRFIFLNHYGVTNHLNLRLGVDYLTTIQSSGDIPKLVFGKEPWTHAVVSVDIDKEYIVDPTTGVVYDVRSVSDLISSQAVGYDCLRKFGQLDFLKKSPHLCRGYFLMYISSEFWQNVYKWSIQ